MVIMAIPSNDTATASYSIMAYGNNTNALLKYWARSRRYGRSSGIKLGMENFVRSNKTDLAGWVVDAGPLGCPSGSTVRSIRRCA